MNLPILEVKMDRLAESVRSAIMIQEEAIQRNVRIAMDGMIEDGTLDAAIKQMTRDATFKALKEMSESWEIKEAIKKLILEKLQ